MSQSQQSQYAPLAFSTQLAAAAAINRDDAFLGQSIQNLNSALDLIRDDKALKRKKGADLLNSLLDQGQYDVLIKYLDDNSKFVENNNAPQINWTVVFKYVEQYFIRETEKLETTHAKDKKKKDSLTLIEKVYKKATRNRPYIQMKCVYRFLKDRLEKIEYAFVFGYQLFKMLQSFLSFKEYQNEMDTEEWTDLITIFMKLFQTHAKYKFPFSKQIILETMNKCVTLASNLITFTRHIRFKYIKFYKDIILSSDGPSCSIMISGFTKICKLNAIEFREILCQVGEEIIPKILYSGMSFNDEDLYIELFLVQMQLHMPYDKSPDSAAYYAKDEKAWAECIQYIYSFCYDIISDTAKKRDDQFHRNKSISPNLLQIMVKCTNQICHESFDRSTSNDPGEGTSSSRPPKRKMTHRSFHSIIDDVTKMTPGSEKQLTWLTYITVVLDEFPNLIGGKNNFTTLSSIGLALLNVSMGRKEVYSLFRSLLQCEKYLVNDGMISDRIVYWDRVWESTIKSISQNYVTSEAIELLRLLLIETHPIQLNSLLVLYAYGTIQFSTSSLNLLCEFLSRCTLPINISPGGPFDQGTCPRKALIKWLVTSLDTNIYEEEYDDSVVSMIIGSLLVKRSHLIMQHSMKKIQPAKMSFKMQRESFEDDLIKTSFCEIEKDGESTAADNYKDNLTTLIHESGGFVPYENIGENLSNILKCMNENNDENYKELLVLEKKLNWPESLKRLGLIQQRLSLFLNLIDFFEKYGVKMSCQNEIEGLYEETVQAFSDGIEVLRKNKNSKMDHILAIVKCIKNFMKSKDLSPRLFAHLSHKIPQQLHETLRMIFRSSISKWHDMFGGEFGYLIGTTRQGMVGNVEGFKGTLAEDLNHDHVSKDAADISEENCGTTSSTTTSTSEKLTVYQKCELISLEALRCILEYGLCSDQPVEYLYEHVCKELSEEMSNRQLYVFEMAANVLDRLIPELSLFPLYGLTTPLILLLQSMCRHYHKNTNCCVRLWKIFGELAKYLVLFIANDDKIVYKYMILVEGLTNQQQSTDKINLLCARLICLTEISKYDPSLSWSWTIPQPKGSLNYSIGGRPLEKVYVLLKNFEHLSSFSHKVRLTAIDQIVNVFLNASPPPIPGADQLQRDPNDSIINSMRKNFYEKDVTNMLSNVLKVEADLTPDEVQQEGKNRIATALLTLTRLIFSNSYIEKRAIVHLFHIFKFEKIDVELVNRALKKASPKSTRTLECHVFYIVEKWVKSFNIEEFPYIFFDCKSIEEFYNKFKKEITIQFFQQNKLSSIEKFAENLKYTSHVDLLKECYGCIMARLVPALSNGPNLIVDASPTKQFSNMNNCHQRLINVLGGNKAAEALTMDHIGDIVLSILSFVHDVQVPSMRWKCLEIRLPDVESYFSNEEDTKKYLNFLKDASPRQDISIIGLLIQWKSTTVYNILLTLLLRIHNSHDNLERFWRLHQFSFFVKLILEETADVLKELISFISQFVAYSYIRLLSGDFFEDDNFVQAVVFVINEFVQLLNLRSPSELSIHYQPIISKLMDITLKKPHLFNYTKLPLDFLILSNGSRYQNCLNSLDPFPGHFNGFEEYNRVYIEKKYGQGNKWSLNKELQCSIENFERHGEIRISKERLQFIRGLLSSNKGEFSKLVASMEGKRFSCEFEHDVVHKLIQHLLNISMFSQDKDVVYEANRCLGEIGPIDLSIQVMSALDCGSRMIIKSTSLPKLIPSIVEMISSFLISDDINLVETAGQVLSSMTELHEVSSVLKNDYERKYPRMGSILKPFKTSPVKLINIENIIYDRLENHLRSVIVLNEFMDFPTWIINLTCGLINCIEPKGCLPSRLLPLCQLKAEFSNDILPYVVQTILLNGRPNPLVKRALSEFVKTFFGKFEHLCGSAKQKEHYGKHISIYLNKLGLKSLLEVVQFLRLHKLPKPDKVVKGVPKKNSTRYPQLNFEQNKRLTPWDNNFWLDINYFDLAKAAQFCGAYLTSIHFAEIFASNRENLPVTADSFNGLIDEDSNDQFYSQNTTFYPPNPNEAKKIEKLLLKSYASIGEKDATFGCGSARFSDFQSSIEYLQQQKEWGRVLSSFDNATDDNAYQKIGICSSLKEMGLYSTLWTFLQGTNVNTQNPELSEIQYECGWRLSKWDLNSDKSNFHFEPINTEHSAIHKLIHESMHSGLIDDKLNSTESIQRAFQNIVIDLKQASLESSENIYGFLSSFQIVRIIEDFFDTSNINNFLSKWKAQHLIPTTDFKYIEPILFAKNVLLQAYDERHPSINVTSGYIESMLDLLTKAREAGHLDLAENIVSKIIPNPDIQVRVNLEIAKNNWERGNHQKGVAKHLLGKLIKKNTPENCQLYPSMLLLLGEWLIKTMSERPTKILEDYLQRSVTIYESRNNVSNDEVSKAHIILAKYSDLQYQNISKYIKSELFEDKIKHTERSKAELNTSSIGVSADDVEYRRSTFILKKQTNLDEQEIVATRKEKTNFLQMALRHYLRGLCKSNEYDLLIFRAVSLWLDNAVDSKDILNSKDSESITRIVKAELSHVPSYKFIVVLHQLSARMGSSNMDMDSHIRQILLTCAKDHPFHSLPVLLTQALLHKDKEKIKKQVTADRVKAAETLISLLKKDKDKEISTLVKKMESLWEALIDLSNVEGKKNSTGAFEIPTSSKDKHGLLKLENLEGVSVPTLEIPVSPSKNYKNRIIGIKSFKKNYNLVGGINSPKRISCIGTDGKSVDMLLKGNDDIRQDAVMQQVFAVMNKLLMKEPKTKARKLNVRTYKCVPLSQTCGIIHWCQNTQTFGDYLIGSDMNTGAHQSYRPQDLTPQVCRTKLSCKKDCRDNAQKLEIFLGIYENFKPVFRHFFFENFLDAGTFFERRLAYTRSVASSSMVGYILGLGDRHVLNILLDKSTAEFIHIDLGVAFDQGKVLPTPELVPFRLTRDVVDGMGVSGVEGVFRRSCKMTLDVLRNNAEIILTILEVLLYDPLYMWTLTADRMQKVQPVETQVKKRGSFVSSILNVNTEDVPKERNNSASRVLLRLKQKLMGFEDGSSSGALSVPGHVSQLIQQAMDPERLSRLFPGWQPYL